jgi:hypothetical protein
MFLGESLTTCSSSGTNLIMTGFIVALKTKPQDDVFLAFAEALKPGSRVYESARYIRFHGLTLPVTFNISLVGICNKTDGTKTYLRNSYD